MANKVSKKTLVKQSELSIPDEIAMLEARLDYLRDAVRVREQQLLQHPIIECLRKRVLFYLKVNNQELKIETTAPVSLRILNWKDVEVQIDYEPTFAKLENDLLDDTSKFLEEIRQQVEDLCIEKDVVFKNNFEDLFLDSIRG
jgi:hypothetical protein